MGLKLKCQQRCSFWGIRGSTCFPFLPVSKVCLHSFACGLSHRFQSQMLHYSNFGFCCHIFFSDLSYLFHKDSCDAKSPLPHKVNQPWFVGIREWASLGATPWDCVGPWASHMQWLGKCMHTGIVLLGSFFFSQNSITRFWKTQWRECGRSHGEELRLLSKLQLSSSQ